MFYLWNITFYWTWTYFFVFPRTVESQSGSRKKLLLTFRPLSNIYLQLLIHLELSLVNLKSPRLFRFSNPEIKNRWTIILLFLCWAASQRLSKKLLALASLLFSIQTTWFLKHNTASRKNKSTRHPLIHFIDHVSTALDKKEHTVP